MTPLIPPETRGPALGLVLTLARLLLGLVLWHTGCPLPAEPSLPPPWPHSSEHMPQVSPCTPRMCYRASLSVSLYVRTAGEPRDTVDVSVLQRAWHWAWALQVLHKCLLNE